MKFAEPLWLLAGTVAVAAMLLAWRRYDRRQQIALAAFASSHLHAQLTASFSPGRRNLKRALLCGCVIGIFLALARPQAGFRWEEVKRRGIEVMFAVDTSRSMLSPDVKPDRLTRAKLAVHDFVNRLGGDGVGLVAFAGSAFLQCPVTLDYDAFHESLDALDTTIIPRPGTDVASAIREAQAALQNRGSKDKILILLTDGEDLEGNALSAAKAAAADGLKIYTVGVGTASGELIPLPADQGGGFLKDSAGQIVKSRLDEGGLKAIAEASSGLYAALGSQGQGLDTIYQEALAPLAKHELAARQQKVYTERFQWPLAAALLCLIGSLLVSTRRRVKLPQAEAVPSTAMELPALATSRTKLLPQSAAALLLGAALFGPLAPAQASPGKAEQAYQKGDFATAQKEFAEAAQRHPKKTDLQFNVGTAAYKAGDFAQAAEAFQKSLATGPSADAKTLQAQQDTFYNLGNTLYRTGQQTEQSDPQQTIQTWEQAVKTYDAALQLRADDADAKYNRDLVQRKLDELKKKQEQQKSQQQQQDQQDQKQDQKKDQQGQSDQKKDQENKDQQQSQPKDQQNQSGQNSDQKQDNQPKDQKSGSDSKPEQKQAEKKDSPSQAGQDQQEDQKQEGKQDQQAPPDQKRLPEKKDQPQQGQQPKPDQGQPKDADQAAGGDHQKRIAEQQADAQRVPGQMSKEEAKNLLDSLKGEERRLPVAPLSRGGEQPQNDVPRKDW
jgi:Ca-activated chloride channel homolog